MTTQICIATGQPLANLIPILHFKPQKIILVVTDSMKVKAKEFKKILNDLGIAETVFMLDGCPDTDLKEIGHFLLEKLAPKLPQENCMFNLTGGTKLHSFSMYENFKERGYNDQFIYVDTNNRLLEYYPSQQVSNNEPLPSVLTAKTTLKGMGKTSLSAESDNDEWVEEIKSSEALTRFIASHLVDNNVKQLIGSLNEVIGRLYNGGKKFCFG